MRNHEEDTEEHKNYSKRKTFICNWNWRRLQGRFVECIVTSERVRKKMQFKTMKKIEIMCLKVEALLIVTFAELIFW